MKKKMIFKKYFSKKKKKKKLFFKSNEILQVKIFLKMSFDKKKINKFEDFF